MLLLATKPPGPVSCFDCLFSRDLSRSFIASGNYFNINLMTSWSRCRLHLILPCCVSSKQRPQEAAAPLHSTPEPPCYNNLPTDLSTTTSTTVPTTCTHPLANCSLLPRSSHRVSPSRCPSLHFTRLFLSSILGNFSSLCSCCFSFRPH